uniref:Kringle domain-containing protein n=1 Tax=Fundulus heteroclitus TaxID=8078 RepID=A0A3Q2SQT3_FUNHE
IYYCNYVTMFCVCALEGRRNALQDYQKSDGIQLVVVSPDSSLLTKSRKLSVTKCAKTCSRGKRLPFTCRFVSSDAPVVNSSHFPFSRFCLTADYVRECIVGTGENYRGWRSVTVSGILCQAWASPIPHEHTYHPKRGNYCRNPDNSTIGPWCFTTDPRPHLRHQECGIPQCSQGRLCYICCNGETFINFFTKKVTIGFVYIQKCLCVRYPDKGLHDNYCRNPDGRHRPWCFTTDPNTPWEYCKIKVCGNPGVETTECYEGRGEGYRGTVDMTPSGLACQRWDSQYPHNHTFLPEAYLCKDLRENYCRNPDGQEFPWCFTTDPRVRTMFCTHIPQCSAQNSPVSGKRHGSFV